MTAAQTEFANGLIGGEGPEPGRLACGFSYKNFDPLGFAERSPDRVNFYREAELKHGRIAQLAIVGLIVQENCRLPGERKHGVNQAKPNQTYTDSLAHDAMVERGPMVQLLIWIGLFETLTFPLILNMNDTDREPGDFSLDPLGFCKDPEKKKALQIAELKHCRLGMLAFSGAITQGQLSRDLLVIFALVCSSTHTNPPHLSPAALTGHGYPFLY
ncbi:unnamed protein product [Chrysoparadoxa australica]